MRRRASEAPVCRLPAAPVLANTVEVLRDAQGNALMNNYRYHFRVRAYNGFQPSGVSDNLTVHPVGSVAKGATLPKPNPSFAHVHMSHRQTDISCREQVCST